MIQKCINVVRGEYQRPLPSGVVESLEHLFRDDVFVEMCEVFLKLEHPKCVRPLAYKEHDEEMQRNINNSEGQTNAAEASSSSAPEQPSQTHVRTLSNETVDAAAGEAMDQETTTSCAPTCSCNVTGINFRSALIAMATSLH